MTVHVTVGMPFFNEERFIVAAIRSVLAQTIDDFELLLVDDGSTDASLALARQFEGDPRIVISSDGMRRGLPARLNEIVRRARGELVARMDADDLIHPKRLEREVELLRTVSSCDVVGTWAALIDENEVPFAVVESPPLPASQRDAVERGILVHASMVARRSWLQAFPYDEQLTRAEDRDLWSRTVGETHFGVVREPLYAIRVRANDADFLTDYLMTQRQNRRLYLRSSETLTRAFRLVFMSHVKSTIMFTACKLGLANAVVQRRGRQPTLEERRLIGEMTRRHNS